MSEEKFKGSDGIERTLDEWYDFIMERTVTSDGEEQLEVALHTLRSSVLSTFIMHQIESYEVNNEPDLDWEDDEVQHSYEDMLKKTAKAVGDYFALALADAAENKYTLDGQLDRLLEHIKNMSKTIKSKKAWEQGQRAQLGLGIMAYIHNFKELPSSRKALRSFINCRLGEFSKPLPESATRDYLLWYKLNMICIDNGRGL